MDKQTRLILAIPLTALLTCACLVVAFASGVATAGFFPDRPATCENGLVEIAASPGTPVPLGDGEAVATLTEVIRPADEIVAEGSEFNPKPAPDREFIRVRLDLSCPPQNSTDCSFSSLDFILVGSRGVYGDNLFLPGVERGDEPGEIRPGREAVAFCFFLVSKKERDLVLVYKSLVGDGRAYFALE